MEPRVALIKAFPHYYRDCGIPQTKRIICLGSYGQLGGVSNPGLRLAVRQRLLSGRGQTAFWRKPHRTGLCPADLC